MKILQINKYHYDKDGATRCYFNTAEILAQKGHQVAFFAMKNKNNLPTKWSKYFVNEVDYNSKMSFWKKIKAILNIFYNIEAKKRLELLIDEFKPDVAHLHVFYHQISPSIIHTLKKYNIKIVMTLHDYKLICPNYNLLVRGKIWEKSKKNKYYKCFFDKCVKDSYLKSLVCTLEAYLHKWMRIYDKIDVFISPSYFLINKFKEFGFKKEIKYLPNPLMVNFKNNKDNLKYCNKKYILFFGRLSKEKGVNNLIDSFAKLKTDYQLIIAGDGPEKQNLFNLAKSKNKNVFERINFVGYQKGNNLFSLIKNSKFIIVPSNWYENAPYSVLESMFLGKIVIASKMGGLEELIKNNFTGCLYDLENEEELLKTMKRLFKNSDSINSEISKNAREFAKNNFNKEKYYKEIIDIYKK